MKHLYNSIIIEFGLNNLSIRPERIVYSLLSYLRLFSLILITHVLLRFILLNTAFENNTILNSIDTAYTQGWFEIIFLVILVTILLTGIIRLFKPIRFSGQAIKIELVFFFLYVVEKCYMSDFFFFNFQSFKSIKVDYFFILCFPAGIEIFLRITYALRKRKSYNASLFQESHAIEKDEEDITTRKHITALIANHLDKAYFKHSYSIGIVGDWGIGKSSFLNNLKIKLDKENVFIHFNPWLSTGKNSLLQDFIESLKDELGRYDKSITFELDSYLNSMIELEANTKTSLAKFIKSFTTTGHSSSSELKKVQQSIERIGKRVIVFIDDLDRLDKGEIIDVLKLIRNTGNFSNTVYISCYDKIYLLHALQNFSKRNLNIILDKFFDIEIPVAPFPGKAIKDYIYNNFFIPYSISKDDSEFIMYRIGTNTFTQLRETKKFVSSLVLNYELYGSSLYLYDFFLLEILKVKYPFLPSLLWKEREQFFYEEGTNPIMKFTAALPGEDKETISIEIESYFNRHEEDEFAKHFLSEMDRILIFRLLRLLFSEKPLRHNFAIQQPNFFEYYFYSYIPDSTIKITNWYNAIKKNLYKDDDFFKESFDVKKMDAISDALFTNTAQYKDEFKSHEDGLLDFLMFLVDWSGGKLALNIFVKAFALSENSDKKELFRKHLTKDVPSHQQIDARTNFIATILRSYFYEPEFKINFAEVSDLKQSNQTLFELYYDGLNEITPQV